MDYKLIALDLDDTLLDKKHKISPVTSATIKDLKKRGLKILIATGRMLVSAMPYIKEMGLEGPMITYNGAYVKDISKDSLIYHQPVEEAMAREVAVFARENGMHIQVYQNDQLYADRANEETRLYEEVSGVKAEEVGDLSEFIQGGITKMLVIEQDPEKHSNYFKMLRDEFSSKLTVTVSKRYYIEVMAPGVSKARALKELADFYGIPVEEVIAIGDGLNDKAMIKWAGLGIAMADAPEEVKEVADMIAPPHHEEGVARILKELFG